MARKQHNAPHSRGKESKPAKNRKRSIREGPVHLPPPQIPREYFLGPIVEIKAHSIWKRIEKESPEKRSDDKCCKDHPEPPSVEITGIEFTKALTTLKVKVKASHPCGIMKVTAFLAEVKVEQMPVPGGETVPVEVVTPILFGEDFIEDSDVFNCVKTVRPTLRIPLTEAIGTPFCVAVTAQDCCGGESGAHSLRYLVV
jgi:hypothetical protein